MIALPKTMELLSKFDEKNYDCQKKINHKIEIICCGGEVSFNVICKSATRGTHCSIVGLLKHLWLVLQTVMASLHQAGSKDFASISLFGSVICVSIWN